MINPSALERDAEARQPSPSPRRNWLPLLLALLVLAAAAALWTTADRAPADNSLEAGFARDMMVHHEQAVQMALLIRDRTEDPIIHTMATDMVLTQQHQIGQMFGWLNLWGLPATGSEPVMAWMGHPIEGRMPGMASPEQIEELRGLSGEAADIIFLRLMIPHHESAIPMAEIALQQSDIPAVRALARQILTAQEVEIATMESILAEKTGEDGSDE